MTYEKELEGLREAFEKRVATLANKVRREMIMPACKEHGLKFYSGMGTFFFSKGKETISDMGFHGTNADNLFIKFNIGPIFEVLNLEVSHNQCLGYYVSDYIPPARRRAPIA